MGIFGWTKQEVWKDFREQFLPSVIAECCYDTSEDLADDSFWPNLFNILVDYLLFLLSILALYGWC